MDPGALVPHLFGPHRGARSALEVAGERLEWPALAAAVRVYGDQLRDLGVGVGDRLGVITQGHLATAIALLGNAAYGVVSVPLNPRLGARERDHVLADARPRAVMVADPDEAGPWARPEPLVAIRRGGPAGPLPPALAPERPLLILYTSGTTGAPKGAALRLSGITANLDALADAWAWSADDTVVHALPLFHVHGLVLGLFGGLRAGGGLRWRPRLDPLGLADDLAREPSILFAVPTIYHRLADLSESSASVVAGLRAARLLISGSAALSLREHRRIADRCGRGVLERYGLTETLINCAVRADLGPDPGRVGPPLAGVELRLVDDQRAPIGGDGLPGDDLTLGEVAVRGPSVFSGYLGRDDATAAVLGDDGWFYTGDLATRRADGSIRIVGRRATDLIKSGGFKIGAGEIEAALLEHPEVAEAAVIGVDDDDLGERIVAFVVPRAPGRPVDAKGLARWVADLLAPHKRPREIHGVDALPRSPMGKVQKPLLRGLLPGRTGGAG
ncbi:MAG: AMP-binding protein [Nannocystaceae bacterium]